MQVIGCDTCVPSACFVAFHVIIPDAEADDKSPNYGHKPCSMIR
jgi:hypothetical protein